MQKELKEIMVSSLQECAKDLFKSNYYNAIYYKELANYSQLSATNFHNKMAYSNGFIAGMALAFQASGQFELLQDILSTDTDKMAKIAKDRAQEIIKNIS